MAKFTSVLKASTGYGSLEPYLVQVIQISYTHFGDRTMKQHNYKINL